MYDTYIYMSTFCPHTVVDKIVQTFISRGIKDKKLYKENKNMYENCLNFLQL